MKTPTVAAGLARSFLEYAVALGAPLPALLGGSGLRSEALTDQDARIPLAAYQALIECAIEITVDDALPLRYCVDTRLETVSIVGLIVHSSASMADSLEQLNRYARLMVEVDVMPNGERFSVNAEQGEVWITDNRPDPNSFPALTEIAFGRFIGEFRRHFPDTAFAIALDVTHAKPKHASAYQEILRVPVRFSCARNAMRIDPAWLNKTFDNESAYVFGVFADRADALIAQLDRNQTIKGRIERHLLGILHRGDVTMDDVASDLGMSRQTLYRRLREEQVTFAAIHDELRHRMAIDYLNARKASVNQVAYLLGFSEASSFTRAFKRWTGKTPIEVREGFGLVDFS